MSNFALLKDTWIGRLLTFVWIVVQGAAESEDVVLSASRSHRRPGWAHPRWKRLQVSIHFTVSCLAQRLLVAVIMIFFSPNACQQTTQCFSLTGQRETMFYILRNNLVSNISRIILKTHVFIIDSVSQS